MDLFTIIQYIEDILKENLNTNNTNYTYTNLHDKSIMHYNGKAKSTIIIN